LIYKWKSLQFVEEPSTSSVSFAALTVSRTLKDRSYNFVFFTIFKIIKSNHFEVSP